MSFYKDQIDELIDEGYTFDEAVEKIWQDCYEKEKEERKYLK